jgi:hypothetical protein
VPKKILLSSLLVVILAAIILLPACAPGDVTDPVYLQVLYTWNGTTWNQVTGGGIGAEVDPIFIVSPASGIVAGDIISWNGHPALVTGVHGVGIGDVVGTTLVQELDSKTLDSSVGKGTWTASGVWKLPAMFFNGDITTDRWLNTNTNTFFGRDVVGAGHLAHTGGVEGWSNTAFGFGALYSDNTGWQNSAFGSNSLFANTIGYWNSAFGYDSLGHNVDGLFNTAVGHGALLLNTAGSFNVAVGVQASINNTLGSYNTVLGVTAGYFNNIGDRNVFLGYRSGYNELGSDKLYIANSDTITPLIYGDFSTKDIHLHAATRIGVDDTNYASFADDGTLTLVGTARINKDVGIPLSGFGKGVAAPATVYIGNYIGYEFTNNDVVYYSTEVPYDWDSSSDISIELHWYINEAYATNNGEVRWNLIYTCTKEDGTEAIDATTTTVDSGDINISATAKYLVQTLLTIPVADIQDHDVIGVQIKRIAVASGNNTVAKPVLVGALLEYISNKLGE